MATVQRVIGHEGFIGLFKGNGAQMVRIFPYAATQFTSYEIYKKVNINFMLEYLILFLIFIIFKLIMGV